MKLRKICEEIEYTLLQGSLETEVRDIIYDSRKIAPETMFVCMVGAVTDGHKYIPDAIDKGASVIVLEREEEAAQIPENITVLKVASARLALALMSAALFDHPARKLVTIGLTGTKGKTTTTYMIKKVLEMAGKKVGLIGTIGAMIGEEHLPSKNTTPESYELHRMFAAMVEAGCEYVVMEVSSQGLKLDRTAGILFDYGIFTNLSPDHIGPGEHASFAEYLYCKSRLLRQCQAGIVNRDDRNTEKILFGHTCDIETFSVLGENGVDAPGQKADIVAERITFSMKEGRLYSHFFTDGKEEFLLQMPGIFNVSNALAAILVARHFKIAQDVVKDALQRQTVPGRCENVRISDKFVFLVDYAHNEMSLRNLLGTLRGFDPGRLVVIFGCGGNRSKLRRGRMGETAGRLADFTILTSDNPRWEDPELILDDIESGIKGTSGAYIRIADRRAAVAYAFDHAREGDIIVLAGKGHEDYQEIGGVRYPMEDKELVKKAAEGRGR